MTSENSRLFGQVGVSDNFRITHPEINQTSQYKRVVGTHCETY